MQKPFARNRNSRLQRDSDKASRMILRHNVILCKYGGYEKYIWRQNNGLYAEGFTGQTMLQRRSEREIQGCCRI